MKHALIAVALLFGAASCMTGVTSKVYDHPLLSEQGPVATLVVVRTGTLYGSAFSETVYLEDEPLVRLRIERYAELQITPGTYEIRVSNSHPQTIVLPAGKTHHVAISAGGRWEPFYLLSVSARDVSPYLKTFKHVRD